MGDSSHKYGTRTLDEGLLKKVPAPSASFVPAIDCLQANILKYNSEVFGRYKRFDNENKALIQSET